MLGYDPDRVEVLIYQLVHLTRGGEQTKMSKRRGDVVFLDEFIDEIGVDAARWYLVEPRPRPDDRDRRRPRGGALAEEPGLLRAVRARAHRGHPPERRRRRDLARADRRRSRRRSASSSSGCSSCPRSSRTRREKRGPQAIPTYAIRVADDFHRFYHEHRVLESEQQAFRLALCRATQLVIARCLDLVGVDAPDRM